MPQCLTVKGRVTVPDLAPGHRLSLEDGHIFGLLGSKAKKGIFKKCTSFLNAPKKRTTYFKYSFFFPPPLFFAKIKEKGERSPHLPNATSTFIEYIVVVVVVVVAPPSHSKYAMIGQ